MLGLFLSFWHGIHAVFRSQSLALRVTFWKAQKLTKNAFRALTCPAGACGIFWNQPPPGRANRTSLYTALTRHPWRLDPPTADFKKQLNARSDLLFASLQDDDWPYRSYLFRSYLFSFCLSAISHSFLLFRFFAFCFLLFAFCFLLFAFCFLLFAFCFLLFAFCFWS